MTLTHDFCVVQDRTSKTLIGAGEQRDGVYQLRTLKEACAHRTLWHRRLGHPSDRLSVSLAGAELCRTSSKNEISCEICLRAKQTRDVFQMSSNNADEPFALIHCDVWGPYRVKAASCGV